MSPDFLITSLIIVATPGTGALYTLAKALGDGHRAAIVAAFGCTLGIIPHMALAILGLAAVLQTEPRLFTAIKIAGVLYLVYMAIGLWRAPAPNAAQNAPREKAAAVIRHAILINLLNPKLSIFFLAFLPQFVAQESNEPLLAMTGLSLIFMAMTFVVFAIYGLFAASLRQHVLTRPTIMQGINKLFAATFLLMAGRLALSQR
ncbi:LysE family translocator [Rhizobium sp. RU36D]|uniref:LysE family translocator n=1 Tax=Rhizobium sp. RU36D TaxID=1907415 RepID=UPI0009D8F186|nr:LysE family translocator [Rhizobium sp. RU36D]SMC61878.1 Threonine/homoserine/homoserine lactone efflux protein [Rhizobium sp. RU36D]